MHIYLDCIPCFIRQSLDAARHATEDVSMHERVVREVAALAHHLDMSQSPPAIGQQIHRLIRDLVGVEDPYDKVKRQFNNAALERYPNMRHSVFESQNPFDTAVRLAIAGNIIDFGVNSSLQETELNKVISQCLSEEFADGHFDAFREAVDEAEDILYLADNAGEIVFDRLLIEQMPIDKVTVAVKGAPVINDATMRDAVIAGLPQIVDVIDNGSDAPGTILNNCSQSFRRRFDKADLIIAKGQGNYETLSDVDASIFFILKVKCPVIARDLDCEVGEMILRSSEKSEEH